MPCSLSREKLCEIVSGSALRGDGRATFRGVCSSSSDVRGGELFVALPGAKLHGHSFVDDAFQRGAALALVESREIAERSAFPERCVVVAATLPAFQQLAAWWRAECGTRIVAITGSVGKTTTKEIAAALLLTVGKGSYSQKSYNNHVGVPLSLLQISPDDLWAVIEIGMNHRGEIEPLSRIAAPDVAIVTMIAPCHLEALGSLEAIATEKCDIFEHVKPGGTIVINADDALLRAEVLRRGFAKRFSLRTFGRGEGCDVRLIGSRSRGLDGIDVELAVAGRQIKASMSAIGTHNALNAAGAACAAIALIPSVEATLDVGLQRFRAPLMRLNVIAINDRQRIIDDSDNASPVAVQALLSLVGEVSAETGCRVGLVLGEMRELGPDAELYHRECGKAAAKVRPAFLVGVAPGGAWYVDEVRRAGGTAIHVASPEEAAAWVREHDYDLLVVKGSRGVGLDRAVKILRGE